MNKILAILALLILSVGPSARAACTATEKNKGGGTSNSGTVAATINAVGDLVTASITCYNVPCSIATASLGSQPMTQTSVTGTGSSGNYGVQTIWYVLSASASGSQTISDTTTGSPTDNQIIYVDYTPSAGCAFAHDIDNTQTTGSGTTIGGSITATAGDIEYAFGVTSQTISSVNSPWTQGTIASSTGNADGYILSASGSSTTLNMSMVSGNWSSILTCFKIITASANMPPVVY